MQLIQSLDRTPFDHEEINIATDAVSRLDETLRGSYGIAFITIEGSNIRYWIDGTDPDADSGHMVYNGGNIYFVDPKSVRSLRMIAITNPAVAMITYYK